MISAIDTFFQIDFWDFGDTFYYTELAAYIHNNLAPDLLSVVIVPSQSTNGFGSLFQIYAEDNEIFVSSADVHNAPCTCTPTSTHMNLHTCQRRWL